MTERRGGAVCVDDGLMQAWADLPDELLAIVPANAAYLADAIEALRYGTVTQVWELTEAAFRYSVGLHAAGVYPRPHYAAAVAWALDAVCRQDYSAVCARSLRYSRQALDQWRDALVEMGAHDAAA